MKNNNRQISEGMEMHERHSGVQNSGLLSTRRCQGLPMSTIVLIIIVLIVLVVVLLFFFGFFGKGGEQSRQQGNLAKCQSLCTQVEAYNPATAADVVTHATNVGYCSVDCTKYILCNPRNLCVTTGKITCTGTTPGCS